ncbi:MAG: hypothetical protein ACOYIA_03125 [Eubacteriales bacterium]|jgi:hypothetical protein
MKHFRFATRVIAVLMLLGFILSACSTNSDNPPGEVTDSDNSGDTSDNETDPDEG